MTNPKFKNIDFEDFDEDDSYDEDWYDENGRPTPGGMYDAGGHLNSERYFEYADNVYDSIYDR